MLWGFSGILGRRLTALTGGLVQSVQALQEQGVQETSATQSQGPTC